MLPPDPQFARNDVLRAFNHAQIYLFLGAAIITTGVISSLLAVLRRRPDAVLLWSALLALLYGTRLEMNYQLLWALGLRPPGFQRVVIAVGFLVPVPAFFFFRELNLLGRAGRFACAIVWPVATLLALATLVIGPLTEFRAINNGFVIVALIIIFIALVRTGSNSRDVRLIRRGLIVFIAFAVYDNATMFIGRYDNIEPFGFVFLLVCLGVVAARRSLANEQQLTEIQKELEIAKRIQLSLLPESFPSFPRFQVAARYVPMTSVAGDFYDFLIASNDEAGLLIADVSGHGIPAALIASMVKLAAATLHDNVRAPAKLLTGLNEILCANTFGQYVTAAYVYLDAQSRELRYAAAGHPAMLLMRGGQVLDIHENGMLLGAARDATYTQCSLPLEPGDRLLLYTDGLLEAMNSGGRLFGEESLTEAFKKTKGLVAIDAVQWIVKEVQQWAPTQEDDLTALVCDFDSST